ncbi:MAG: PASTA domain-containing protein [bacterium]
MEIIGTVLNKRYEVTSFIGAGAMADVFFAQDLKLGIPVALKVLRQDWAKDKEFLLRFEREAKAAARIDHPNIVLVYDIEEDCGYHYIVMEYLESARHLGEIIKDEAPMPLPLALSYMTQILEGLSYAHAKGIIHRDIKPQNILATPDGKLKITDFGIAKAVTSDTLTQTGSIFGSVHYFSPEQAQGKPVDTTCDLYSTAIILFEMLTGRLPFEDENPVSVALKQVQEEPPLPRSLNPEIPESIENVILKMLSKKPSERYQDAGGMLEALGGRRETVVLQRKRGSKGDSVPIIPIAVAVVALLVAFFIFFWLRQVRTVTVPSLVNLPFEAARSLMGEKKVNLEIKGEVVNDALPNRTIARQDPEAGTLIRSGQTIFVVVTKKEDLIQVPNMVGLDLKKAVLLLSPGNFILRISREVASDKAKAGQILSQKPEAGLMAKIGSSIMLEISKGVAPRLVPDIVGLSLKEAEKMLARGNLIVQIAGRGSSDNLPADYIISQEPKSGEKTPEYSTVKVVISGGEGNLYAPNLLGKSLQEARKILAGKSLSLKTEGDYEESFQVVSQAPSAGQTLTEPKITVECARMQVVPQLVGKTLEDARLKIMQAGFVVGEIASHVTDQSAPGTVLEQNPAGGIESPEKTRIYLVIVAKKERQ